MSSLNRRQRSSAAALLALWLPLNVAAASPGQRPPLVSMIELLANKEEFNGKPVQVSGYLSIRFEDALYFDESAYVHMFTENALWIDFDETDRASFEKYDRHPGYVIGIFRADDCNGHLCLYGGRLVGAKLGL